MAHPTHLSRRAEDHKVSIPDLHHLLALPPNYDTSTEFLMRLGRWFGKDAPRDHFTASSASPKTSSMTDAHSLKQETDSTYLVRERTDSEKAVKGLEDDDDRLAARDGRVMGLGSHIQNDSSDELSRRGEEADAIINGTDRAFSGYFGSHFEEDVSDDLGLWPLAASNREEAEAMAEGLERAHGK